MASKTGGTSRTRATAAPKAPPLPVVSVARFEEALSLLELMVAENQSVFIQHGQSYRDEHRQATSRPLNAIEAVQVAAGLLGDDRAPEDRAAALQAHPDLRAYDEPAQQEVLLAASVATAPAFLKAALRVTALIELSDQAFEDARESGQLLAAVDQEVEELRKLSLQDAREHAARAFSHFADAAGVEPGKAWALVARSVWQALSQAMSQMNLSDSSSSLTDSQASTGGDDEPSFTEPRIAMPVG